MLVIILLIFLTSYLFGYDVPEIRLLSPKDPLFSSFKREIAKNNRSIYNKRLDIGNLYIIKYVVRSNQSLSYIANRLLLNIDTLCSVNNLSSVYAISNGTQLLIPSMRGLLYRAISTVSINRICKRYKISKKHLYSVNRIKRKYLHRGDIVFLPGAIYSFAKRQFLLGRGFSPPLPGRLSSHYGMRIDPFTHHLAYHGGIDIAAPYGTPVRAVKNGRIIFAGWKGGYGNLVVLAHRLGYTTYYGHLSKIYKRGGFVKRGDIVGYVGATGRATGPHLHFEIRNRNKRINPLTFFGIRHYYKRR